MLAGDGDLGGAGGGPGLALPRGWDGLAGLGGAMNAVLAALLVLLLVLGG